MYIWVLLGSSLTNVMDLLSTQYLLPVVDISVIYYLGAFCELIVLILLYFYHEKLDIENLRKHGALKET